MLDPRVCMPRARSVQEQAAMAAQDAVLQATDAEKNALES
jgi:hypothetical protein